MIQFYQNGPGKYHRNGGLNMAAKVTISGKWAAIHRKAVRPSRQGDYFDVKDGARKLDEMLKYSQGKRKVPVIVEGDKVTVRLRRV